MSISTEILREFLQVSRHLSQKIRMYYGRMSLTYPQSVVLAILDADGPMPVSVLADAAGSANSTISGVLDRLETMQLVKRERSTLDRRIIYVSVTDHFNQLIQQVKSNTANQFDAAIRRLSEEDQQTIQNGLSLLNEALKHRPGV